MTDSDTAGVHTLTFDVFETILDLTGSVVPPLNAFLENKATSMSGDTHWGHCRARQRIEQYQDSLLFLGHSGYL